MYIAQNPRTFNPTVELFIQLQRRENPPVQGENQKQRSISEARRQGYREGVVEGITTILNKYRCEMYPHWERVPLLDTHEVGKTVQLWLEKYQTLESNLPSMPKTDDEKKADREGRDQFFNDLGIEFYSLAVGGEMEERELERHTQAVLAGEEDPTESDRPWLEERLAKARALNKEIEDLIKVVTPRGRPIKDQPQA